MPYSSYPYARTQPDRLCTLARLFRLAPAEPSRCRVLELGCASGGNLVPMAERAPESEFVGVDLSARQIDDGRHMVAALGLRNVELRHASILDVDASWGTFDYVICHGVYSWVPPEVQSHILAICSERLAPQGIGYVSYNTYPGWHVREMVRHMMRWHVRGFAEPLRRVEQSRALIDFLARAVADQAGPYGALLGKELAILRRAGDDYLYHEHLEDCNAPIYFHEFAERIDRHRLQYLCESDVHMMLAREFPDDVRATLDRVAPDLVRMEQYVDFVRNRQFRASLVCHADAQPSRALGPESVMGLRIGFAGAQDDVPCDLSPGLPHAFEGVEGMRITSEQPITKAALLILRRLWPGDLAFDELWRRAAGLLAEAGLDVGDEQQSRARLGGDFLECLMGGGGLELRREAPGLVATPGEHPRTSASARWLARARGWAASGRHQRVDLDAVAIEIVCAADGTRDRDALLEALIVQAQSGVLAVHADDERIVDPDELREPLREVMDRTIELLARYGLFVA
ncbi:MAG TPA: class I SAM-dependent methyltransferase [Nannocystaceae bacterium]|nr:class I SAM-dependent methyltransferase [Nannocystaceae bacterium]